MADGVSFLRGHYNGDLYKAREQAAQCKRRERQCKGPGVGVGLMWSKTAKEARENAEQ